MEKKAALWFAFIGFLWLLPYVFTVALNGIDTAFLNRSPEVEDYLPAALSFQIPADYQLEAIEAQAVIARTNLCRRLQEKESITKILGEWKEEIKESHGWRNFPADVYETASKETEGKILTAEGELKLVPYHELSRGQTRDGETAFHDEKYSYLKSVDSSIDKESPSYLNSTYISVQQMPSELNIEEREESGYIVSLRADGNLLEGESFAQGMGLSSSNFTIQKIGDEIRFLCRGKGHGLGFSQFGGNELAKQGKSWEEILKTYFPAMEQTDYMEL